MTPCLWSSKTVYMHASYPQPGVVITEQYANLDVCKWFVSLHLEDQAGYAGSDMRTKLYIQE